MTDSAFCPMIHGGLQISYDDQLGKFAIQSCCIRTTSTIIEDTSNIWNHPSLIPLRDLNKTSTWDEGCFNCQSIENAGQTSFRTGMIDKFGTKTNLSGPQRIDLMFDRSCNLACRTCGPRYSTFWQQHLKKNNLIVNEIIQHESPTNQIIELLNTLDLSNLEMLVFCGGETLMGNNYWKIVEYLANVVPNANKQLTISFQTNGSQTIPEKYYELIEKFQLVKLYISLDATAERFNYMRWPADWSQVTENIFSLRDNLPVNVMFLIEETISIFNLYYQHELDIWAKNNFSTNRLGDIINHTRHLAGGTFDIKNVTNKYADALKGTELYNMIQGIDTNNAENIQKMIDTIDQFDKLRGEDWRKTFPEVADFYSDYLR